LNQNGFDTTLGINVNRWLGLGTDFSIFKGSTNLGFGTTTLGSQLASVAPAGLVPLLSGLSVPISATTYTWGIGSKVNLRKWSKLTLFAHPGLGLMHESTNLNLAQLTALEANPQAASLLATPGVVQILAKLKSNLTDTVPFFGAGVGFDINASKHVGVRFAADWVRSHIYSSLLNWQDNVRISVGPVWGFGQAPRTSK
jgi:hypothetical protein